MNLPQSVVIRLEGASEQAREHLKLLKTARRLVEAPTPKGLSAVVAQLTDETSLVMHQLERLDCEPEVRRLIASLQAAQRALERVCELRRALLQLPRMPLEALADRFEREPVVFASPVPGLRDLATGATVVAVLVGIQHSPAALVAIGVLGGLVTLAVWRVIDTRVVGQWRTLSNVFASHRVVVTSERLIDAPFQARLSEVQAVRITPAGKKARVDIFLASKAQHTTLIGWPTGLLSALREAGVAVQNDWWPVA